MVRRQGTMILWLMLLIRALVAIDEFGEFTKIAEGDILPNEDKLIMSIVPGYNLDKGKQPESKKTNYVPYMDGIDMNNEHLKNFNSWIEKGVTKKGLIFNIYNDDMREAAVTLFRLFLLVEGENYTNLKKWSEQNINSEMFLYAFRLSALYGSKTPENQIILPPYILNPHYFVNSETITKAYTILNDLRELGHIDNETADIYQYEYVVSSAKTPRYYITIKSNYSGWNRPVNGMDKEINYFREDVGLNSYYLGLHLLHPFWMSNEELNQNFPKHTEHYYYAHQQLMARYDLEKEHLPMNRSKCENSEAGCGFVTYLSYKNGLAFPTRPCNTGFWNIDTYFIKTIDIAINECIDRGLIMMLNGSSINITDDSHVEELSRLIRANLDGIKSAKVVRSVFGYGSKIPVDDYSPAPSLLHHPETSLRDPAYWMLIRYTLNYFTKHLNSIKPYDLTQYETEDIKIINENFTDLNLKTYFYSYKFTLDHARNVKDSGDRQTFMAVKQRRLNHEPFQIYLKIEATIKTKAVVRLYLGPLCGSDCWKKYSNFYELDTFVADLREGNNDVVMHSKFSKKYSSDCGRTKLDGLNRSSTLCSIYQFPKNLMIPRGLENGLNLTLFAMVTLADEDWIQPANNFNYRRAVELFDDKPLGFPFHRPAAGFKDSASNYRFYNITIYHRRQSDDACNSCFSENLY